MKNTAAKNPDAYKKIIVLLLAIIAGVAITVSLIYTKSFLMPLIIALMIHTAIAPAVRFLSDKLKMPHILAAGITFAFITAAFVLFVLLVSDSVNSFIDGADVYERKISETFAWLTATAQKYGYSLNFSSFADAVNGLPVFGLIKGMGMSVFAFFSYAALCFVFLIFFFLGGEMTMQNKQHLRIAREIQNKISFYLIATVLISAASASLFGILLSAFGVELAFIFALIAFILFFIPEVGAIAATVLPLPVMFLQLGLGPAFFILLGLLILVQFILGNIVSPKVLSDGVDLHPVFILCALVFWALVWGVAGAFLAVPMMAALKIILSKIPPAKPLAELMAGRL